MTMQKHIPFILSFALALFSLSAAASVWYARPDPDPAAVENPDYCKTPELAGSIPDALGKLASGDELKLLDGVYAADWAAAGISVSLKEFTVSSVSSNREACVIDGGGATGARRALRIRNSGYEQRVARFHDLTFRNFYALNDTGNTRGGVFLVDACCSLECVRCDFLNNLCGPLGQKDSYWYRVGGYGHGGVIFADGGYNNRSLMGHLWLEDCTFRGNQAGGTGSCVCSVKTTMINRCLFEDNLASNIVSDVSYYTGTVCVDPCNYYYMIIPDSVVSNTVFRRNYHHSASQIRAGSIHNLSSYNCEFYDCGASGASAGATHGSIIWEYDLGAIFTNELDLIDNSTREGNWNFTDTEVRGGRYYRCRFQNTDARGSQFDSHLGVYYNCLFQDLHYQHFCPLQLWNCTLAHVEVHGGWGAQFVNEGIMVNTLMADCWTPSSHLCGWNKGPYGLGNLYVTNSVYYGEPYQVWDCNNNISFTNAPPTEYFFEGTGQHPYALTKGSFGIDYGIEYDGMREKGGILARDMKGKRRISGVAPDVGCYEYNYKSGFAVRVR